MPDLMPIGTVLTLKDGNKRIMVTGRLVRHHDTGKVYDYCAVLWPEGYTGTDGNFLFDHKDIHLLHHIGLQDGQEFNWRSELERQYKRFK